MKLPISASVLGLASLAWIGGCAAPGPDESASSDDQAVTSSQNALKTIGDAAKKLNAQRENDSFSIYEFSSVQATSLKASRIAKGYIVIGDKTAATDEKFAAKAAAISAKCGFFLFGDPNVQDKDLVSTMAGSLAQTAKTSLTKTVKPASVYEVKPTSTSVADTMGCGVAFEQDGRIVVLQGTWLD